MKSKICATFAGFQEKFYKFKSKFEKKIFKFFEATLQDLLPEGYFFVLWNLLINKK